MLIRIYPFLALGGAVWCVLGTEMHPLWGIPLFFGFFLALIALFFLLGILLAPLFPKKEMPKKPRPLARFVLVEAYAMALVFMQVHARVRGLDKLPKKGTTFLVVCNHLSNYDHMLMLTKMRKFPISFISKPENFEIPIVGRYLWNAGFLSIDRKRARNAIATVNETAERIASGGMCYGVFPEGTRSRTGKLLPFHSGVFLTATKAKAPIVVVHMAGTQRVNHRGPWLPTRVEMDILEYLDADYVTSHTDMEICEHTYGMMLEKFPNSEE